MEGAPRKGFFASLFDLSFDDLITPRIITILYVLFMVVIGLVAIGFVIAAFASDTGLGVLTLLVLAPIGALLYLILIRVYLELIVVIFKIRDAADRIASK